MRIGGKFLGSGIAAMAALALAACSAGLNCTLAGCASIVQVDLAELHDKLSRRAFTATLCVEGVCRNQPLSGLQHVVMADLPSSSATAGTPVRLTLRVSRGAEILADIATTATLTRSTPNGERCGPVCFSALLTLHDGRLTPSAT